MYSKGKFCVFLHHHGVIIVALWSLILNSFGRKKDFRKCKFTHRWYLDKFYKINCIVLYIFSVTKMVVSEGFIDIKNALLPVNNLVQIWLTKPQVVPEQAGSIELQNFDQQ